MSMIRSPASEDLRCSVENRTRIGRCWLKATKRLGPRQVCKTHYIRRRDGLTYVKLDK